MKRSKKFSSIAIMGLVVLLLSSISFANPHTPPPGGGGGVVTPPPIAITFRIDVPGFQVAGQQKTMVASYLKQGNTMMPIRMLEDLGVQLDWNQATRTATLVFGTNTVTVTIGSTDAYINGVRTPIVGANGLLMAPELAPPGRTMIPARFVSEKLGFVVDWAADRTITITTR